MHRYIRQIALATLLCATLWGDEPAASLEIVPQQMEAPDVDLKLDLYQKTLPANTVNKAVLDVSLAAHPSAAPRMPVNLAVVLDRSASMRGRRLDTAKEALVRMVKQLSKSDRFSLVTYETKVDTVVPSQSAGNLGFIIERVNGIEPGRNTALFGGISRGAAELRKNTGNHYVHRLIVLSDGRANVGPGNAGDLERLGSALFKEGISVSTIGIGNEYNEDLMTRLTQASDGNAYDLADVTGLSKVLDAELKDILSVVGTKVSVEISFLKGVKPVRFLGRNGKIRSNKAQIQLNQVYADLRKHVLVEVEIDETPEDATRQLATSSITYRNRYGRLARSTGSVSAKFSSKEKLLVASINPGVVTEVGLNRSSEVIDQSIELVDKGKQLEAVQNLLYNGIQLMQEGNRLGNNDLFQQGEILAESGRHLQSNSTLTPRNRKGMRVTSQNTRGQQRNYARNYYDNRPKEALQQARSKVQKTQRKTNSSASLLTKNQKKGEAKEQARLEERKLEFWQRYYDLNSETGKKAKK